MPEHERKELKQKRKKHNDSSDTMNFMGPWMPKKEEVYEEVELTDEQKNILAQMSKKKVKSDLDDFDGFVESTQFLGAEEVDFQVRVLLGRRAVFFSGNRLTKWTGSIVC